MHLLRYLRRSKLTVRYGAQNLADQEETRNGGGEEAERALWFHRFFYGCEPDAADIRRILNLFKGYSTTP